jgi:hypothetical protein
MTEKRSPVQDLFDHVFKSGKIGTNFDADRRREGTYVNGFNNRIETATLEIAGYVVQAKRTEYKLFSLAGDTQGERYALEVCKGSEVVLEATRQGASSTKKFGAEERYIGTDTTPEGEWVVAKGTLPQELEALPA